MTGIAHQLGFATLNDFLVFAAAHNSYVAPPTCAGAVASDAPIDTSLPGPHTFTVTATDVAFTVVGGALVSDPNTATAGSSAQSTNRRSSTRSRPARPCRSSSAWVAPAGSASWPPTRRRRTTRAAAKVTGPAVASTAGNSGVQYDAASDTYTYVWKTDKGWAGTCRS
jgi:hypothetical protein